MTTEDGTLSTAVEGARRAAFTAPSREAARAGMALLEDGASAVEAMVAAAATIAVSYPHMNSVGGDGFWLILPAEGKPVGFLAGGPSGAAVGPHLWIDGQPTRGVGAMLTVPGAVGGWQAALEYDAGITRRPRPLGELLSPAIALARNGCPASSSLVRTLADKVDELREVPGFAALFLAHGMPRTGERIAMPALARLLERLAAAGLDDFYRGDVGAQIGAALRDLDAVIDAGDLAGYRAARVDPIAVRLASGFAWNLPAPTQGLASLVILGIYDRLRGGAGSAADHVHLLVEATKQALLLRDRVIGDPRRAPLDYSALLDSRQIDWMCQAVSAERAAPWPASGASADTVWMGALDRAGNMVSYIQSTYWEFGSGVVIPGTGMLWANRGLCFDVDPGSVNAIGPGRVPRHTLNPAAAFLDDGRRMVFGAMGGDGQPQTQSALWWRYVVEGVGPSDAVAAPRWLLGRTWGEGSANLKIERSLADEVLGELVARGHDAVVVDDNNELMGHAGMIVHGARGEIEAACDPRSDGEATTGTGQR